MAKDSYYTKLYDNPLGCAEFALLAVLYLYLKFLCIWRFFRAWALLDGVYPPENMPQCKCRHPFVNTLLLRGCFCFSVMPLKQSMWCDTGWVVLCCPPFYMVGGWSTPQGCSLLPNVC